MKIRQYCCFAITSTEVTAADVTARLLVEPDRVLVRGSRRTVPKPVPVCHSWAIECDSPGLRVDEQLDVILDRLAPHLAAIAGYLDELREAGSDVVARLQVARMFDDEDGEEEELTETGDGAVKLGGQHQLLGWRIERPVLDFLQLMRAELDVDECG